MKKICLLAILLFGVYAGAQTAQGTITATASTCSTSANTAGACVILPLANAAGGASITVSGTYVGTLQFEVSGDNQGTWTAINATPPNSTTAVTSTTSTGVWQLNVAGFTHLRVRCSAYTSGTAFATIQANPVAARSGSSGGGSGTVTTTGTPANGNLTFFSGATSVTNGNLSGDATTSGTGAVSVVKVNGNTPGGTCTNQAVTALSSSAVPTCTTLTSAYVDSTVATTSGTQNLSNKTLTQASSGNTVNLLNFQPQNTAVTGTTADVALYTYNMPGNVLAINKCLRVTFGFLHGTGTVSVAYKIKFGATTVSTGSSTANVQGWQQAVVCNNAATNAQTWISAPPGAVSGTGFVPTAGTAAIDTTASVAITGTMNVAATDTVTPSFWMVELIQ